MIGFNLIFLPSDLKQDWRARVSRQGNTQRKDAVRITYSEVRRVGRLYLSGMRVEDIAKIRNTTMTRVYKVLGYTGFPKWMKQMNTLNASRRRQGSRPMGVHTYLTSSL